MGAGARRRIETAGHGHANKMFYQIRCSWEIDLLRARQDNRHHAARYRCTEHIHLMKMKFPRTLVSVWRGCTHTSCQDFLTPTLSNMRIKQVLCTQKAGRLASICELSYGRLASFQAQRDEAMGRLVYTNLKCTLPSC